MSLYNVQDIILALPFVTMPSWAELTAVWTSSLGSAPTHVLCLSELSCSDTMNAVTE